MKNLKALMFAAALSITGAASAGIPVADGIQLAQSISISMAEQVMHEALAQARNKLSEKLSEQGISVDRELSKRSEDFAWEMYEDTTKKHGYGWNYEIGSAEFYKHMETYTDEALKNKDAESMEESLEIYKAQVDADYRKANGMQSDEVHIQKALDKDLNWKVMVDNTLGETNKRHKSIQDLRVKADAAKTAQEKADLQVAIGIEQNAVSNEALRMQLATEAQKVEKIAERHRMNNAVREEFKKITIDYN